MAHGAAHFVRKPKQKYPLMRAVAVDVDGTLFIGGVVNTALVQWCRKRKSEGFELTLWSSRGREYAQRAARLANVHDVFDHIISKPGYLVDDVGWSWIRYTRVVPLHAIAIADQLAQAENQPEGSK